MGYSFHTDIGWFCVMTSVLAIAYFISVSSTLRSPSRAHMAMEKGMEGNIAEEGEIADVGRTV